MKTFSTVSGVLLKTLAVLGLIVAAGLGGVGVAAFFAFHDGGGTSERARLSRASARAEDETPRVISIARLDRWEGEKIVMNVDASLAANRFVAAESSDQPAYSYADYQPVSTDVSVRKLAANMAPNGATMVPPPLEPSVDVAATASAATQVPQAGRLTDPGSRYIVQPGTGKVIGIDGTAGAMEEARQQQQQMAVAPGRGREVRAALPADAEFASSDLPPPKPELYPAVRRALPSVDENVPTAAASEPQPFNAAAEVAEDSRPVMRAQSVMSSQPAKSRGWSIFGR